MEPKKEETGLDKSQAGGMTLKRTIMSKEVCELFLAQNGKDYRSKRKIRAVVMTAPFEIETETGIGKGEAGDLLVNDNGLRVIMGNGFKVLYAPFRKPRERTLSNSKSNAIHR